MQIEDTLANSENIFIIWQHMCCKFKNAANTHNATKYKSTTNARSATREMPCK